MIKKNLKILIITSIIILLPMVAGLILWNQLPEQIPVHWNANGEVDGWSSKAFAVKKSHQVRYNCHSHLG